MAMMYDTVSLLNMYSEFICMSFGIVSITSHHFSIVLQIILHSKLKGQKSHLTLGWLLSINVI